MKRIVPLLAVLLLAASLATPAVAKKKVKPIATTFYLHGATPVGENDSLAVVNDVYLPMDQNEPAQDAPASRFIVNGIATPNTKCAGNNLFPVWSGKVSGRITGDVKLTFTTVGTPGSVVVRIWPDVNSLLCDSAAAGTTEYPDPAGEVTVALPPGTGTVEAVMEDVDFSAVASVMVQISPAVAAELPEPAGAVLDPFVARVLYDNADFASSLEFACIPPKGASTCI